jgi:hypothetical protein
MMSKRSQKLHLQLLNLSNNWGAVRAGTVYICVTILNVDQTLVHTLLFYSVLNFEATSLSCLVKA